MADGVSFVLMDLSQMSNTQIIRISSDYTVMGWHQTKPDDNTFCCNAASVISYAWLPCMVKIITKQGYA